MKHLIVIFYIFCSCLYAAKPNILLILSDDHSIPHLGAYGDKNCLKYKLTPNLDMMAKEGMLFNNVYTSSPQCAPSRISIFAGQSPVALSVTRFAQPSRPETVFFTDILRANGYWVGIDGRHHHLDGRMREADHMTQALKDADMKSFDKRFDHFMISKTKGEYLKKVKSTFESILDKVPEKKPFFLYFGFNQPHRRFDPDHEEIEPSALILPEDWPDLKSVRVDYARYLSEVRDMDIGFGMIEEVLKKRALKKNTIVIFMGDNGEALLRGKGTLYKRGLNVPFIIRWPEIVKENTVNNKLISGIDLAPTILDILDLKRNKKMTGKSFYPALKGEPFKGNKYIFAERGWHFGPLTNTTGLDLSRSVTYGDYHFIYNALPDRSFSPVGMYDRPVWLEIVNQHKKNALSKLHEQIYFQSPRPTFELYNNNIDPNNINNLSGQTKFMALEKELREQLDQWMIRESDYLPLPSHVHGFIIKKRKK